MTSLTINYNFHPVGQGLFSSGALINNDRPDQLFSWVYDCGSTSAQRYVADAIEGMLRRVFGRAMPRIDLITISHFDKDHISGLVTLLSKFRVEALLLPYMPLWQRLTLASAEGIGAQEPLFAFFVDPVAYIIGIGGAQIGQIILVPPSAGEGPDGGGEGAPPPLEGPWQLDVDGSEPTDEEQHMDYQAFAVQAAKAGTQVRFMRPGGSLRAAGVWEFVPYNDATFAPKATDAFRAQIAALQARLLNPLYGDDRNTVLNAIKQSYDATFGRSAKNRNEISLFLYGGPLKSWQEFRLLNWVSSPGLIHSDGGRGGSGGQPNRPKVSILYTGDGYLDTPQRTDRLLGYLGRSRVSQLCVVQVMHHGAQGNWYHGVAARLAPSLSIFSSDPTNRKLGHPHRPVWDDFSPYQPVQVDKSSGCSINAWIMA
jgi:hypothetical protein